MRRLTGKDVDDAVCFSTTHVDPYRKHRGGYALAMHADSESAA